MKNITQIEHEIGAISGQNNWNTIEGLIEQNRYLFNTWLILNGIPRKDTLRAFETTIAKAYANKAYLTSWRSHMNPKWKQANAILSALEEMGNSCENTEEEGEKLPAPLINEAGKQICENCQGTGTVMAKKSHPSRGIEVLETCPNCRGKGLIEISEEVNNIASVPEFDLSAIVKNTIMEIMPLCKDWATRETQEILQKIKFDIDPENKKKLKEELTTHISEILAAQLPPKKIVITNAEGIITEDLGLQHECFPTLLRAAQARDHKNRRLNIWLTGPTGSGKTSAAEAVAKALSLPFASDGSLDADYKIIGFRDASGLCQWTEFRKIFTNGGIYVADEIDNWHPSALLALNAALANGWCSFPDGLTPRHPDCIVIACANTWGHGANSDYVGRTKLDAASLDRFFPKIYWPYDEKLERAIAEEMAGLSGRNWAMRVQELRRRIATQGLKIIISPRMTFTGIALSAAGFDQDEIEKMTWKSGLSREQIQAIK